MAFGRKVGSVKKLKQDLKKSSGAGFIKYIPKEGSINVRFLTEPNEWVNYTEVWDAELNRGYPLPDDPDMPGAELDPDTRKSSRWLAPVLDVEENQVICIQLAKTLVDQLMMYYDKFGTLTDRDYELMRQGKGTNTTYGLVLDSPKKRNTAKVKLPDLEAVLEAAYNSVWGDQQDDEDDDDEKPAKAKGRASRAKDAGKAGKSTASKRRAKSVEEDDEDDIDEDDDDDVEDDEADESDVDGDDDDDDGDDEGGDDDESDEADDDEYWDEDSLGELTLAELKTVAREAGVDIKRGMKKDALIDAIMEALEE